MMGPVMNQDRNSSSVHVWSCTVADYRYLSILSVDENQPFVG